MKFWTETDLVSCIRTHIYIYIYIYMYKLNGKEQDINILKKECLGLQAWNIKGDAFAKL